MKGTMLRASAVRRVLGLALAALALGLLAAAAAPAAAIKVTTAADEFNAGSECSLREAVWAANNDRNTMAPGCTAGLGNDVIKVPGGDYALTIAGAGEGAAASGDLDLTAPVTIQHKGRRSAVVDAKSIDRVFEVNVPGGPVTIAGLVIRGGSTPALTDGGGVLNSAGILTVDSSTITGNLSSHWGGGIETKPTGVTHVVNSTISGNQANVDSGGIDTSGGSTSLLNSTVTGNVSDADGNANGKGGGLGNFGGATTMRSTIVAGNTDRSAQADDCFNNAALTSLGQTLIGDSGGCTYVAATGDINGVDPRLGPLADNGGPTPTHALLAGSSAINNGSGCAKTDQRGTPRTAGGACDIGAYEVVSCHGKLVNRVGTNRNDVLSGTPGPDAFLLLGGDDRALGLGGNDAFCGAAGRDTEIGGPGRDRAYGDTGKDRLLGGPGNDLLSGGGGEDRCNGGPGNRDRARACEADKKVP